MPASGRRRVPIAERFWSKVERRGPDECWPWKAARDRYGYGQIGISGVRQLAKAHRVAFELATGCTLRSGEKVLHECDNPPCCNPGHLHLGTQRKNVEECHARGRYRSGNVHGEDSPNAKLTENDVRHIRASSESDRSLAARFGVAKVTIQYARKGRSWKHV